jgi:hypothetical protein
MVEKVWRCNDVIPFLAGLGAVRTDAVHVLVTFGQDELQNRSEAFDLLGAEVALPLVLAQAGLAAP